MQRLGQHFLQNKSAIRKIIDAAELKPGDIVIEIGPGHGELTLDLGFKNKDLRIIAIEKDEVLAENLKNKVVDLGFGNIEVVNSDALSILKSKFINHKSNYKIIGNIPYYITGKLLRILSELPTKPELCVFTIQKEVAERICAAPPRMNRLAAIVQFWASPEIIGIVPRKDFHPQPEVDSAIIKLKSKSQIANGPLRRNASEASKWLDYQRTVRVLFAQPRKTIVNNLSSKSVSGAGKSKENIAEALLTIGIDPKSRPQNLSVEDIVKITQVLVPGPRG